MHAPPAGTLTRPMPSMGRFERLSPRTAQALTAAAVGGLIVVFVVLCARTLHAQLWVDEGISVGIASHPLSAIPHLLREDGSPPLYYLLLHFWIQAFGSSEVRLHELSALFGALTVPAAWWAGRSLFGARAGLIAAALAATSPFLVAYGGDARMYTLVALLGLLAATAFAHAYVHRRRRFLPLFSVALALALYAHNWGIFMGLAFALAFAWLALRSEDRRALPRDGLIGFGAVALLYAPWLPTLAYQASHTGAPWAARPSLWSLTHALYTTSDGRGPAVAILLGAGTGIAAVLRARGDRERRSLGVLLAVALGTVLIAWLYCKISPAWADRYLAIFVGPALLVVALGLSRAGRIGAVALALVLGYWVLDARLLGHERKTNVRSVAVLAREQLSPGDQVVAIQPEQLPALRYYLPATLRYATTLGTPRDPRVMDWRNALPKLRHTSVAGDLAPLIARLGAGQRLLIVAPLDLGNASPWTKLVNRRSSEWIAAARRDPRLHELRVFRPVAQVGTIVAANFVTGILFERR